ncbi:SDR family oxidoreductase [Klebsiella pneumoniae]|nr:SDR family oxidoreductase [Klebsiella pneumoniae]
MRTAARSAARSSPEDVTGSVVWLLSDLSRFITGQLIPVNGGFVFN